MSHDLGWLCDTCNRWWSNGADECEVCHSDKVESPQDKPKPPQIVEKTPIRLSDIQPVKINPNKRRSKWRYMGLIFDSKDEAKRYGYLSALQDVGMIRHLQVQPKAVLRKGFALDNLFYVPRADGSPRTIGGESYTPDYAYLWKDYLVIEDVKGIKNKKDENGIITGQIPYSKTNSTRSQKHLLYRYRNKRHVVFMLTCLHKGVWRYFQMSDSYPELYFSLEQLQQKAS